jgi:hypothetical protein
MLIYAHLFSLANMQKNFAKWAESLKTPAPQSPADGGNGAAKST